MFTLKKRRHESNNNFHTCKWKLKQICWLNSFLIFSWRFSDKILSSFWYFWCRKVRKKYLSITRKFFLLSPHMCSKGKAKIILTTKDIEILRAILYTVVNCCNPVLSKRCRKSWCKRVAVETSCTFQQSFAKFHPHIRLPI